MNLLNEMPKTARQEQMKMNMTMMSNPVIQNMMMANMPGSPPATHIPGLVQPLAFSQMQLIDS
jgi:hypothetical protein